MIRARGKKKTNFGHHSNDGTKATEHLHNQEICHPASKSAPLGANSDVNIFHHYHHYHHHHHDHQEICHTLGSLLGASLEAQCNALMEAQVLVIIIIIHIINIIIIIIIILLSDLVHNVISSFLE